MGKGREEADIYSLVLAGTNTKYGFTLMLGDTNKFQSLFSGMHRKKINIKKIKKHL